MFKNSIRNKLIVLLLLITIIPFGSSVLVTYLYTKETLTEETTKESVNLLYQGKINIENYLNELNNLSLSIYNNPDLMNHLKSSNYQTNYLMQDIVSNVMLTLLYANDSIKRVTISNTEKNYRISVSARSNVVFTSLGMNVNKEIFHKAKNSPNHLFIESIYQNDQLNSIAFHRAIVNVPANNIVGYITLEIDPDKLSELSQRLYHNETEELDIVSPRRRFHFSIG
ncbi:hypothetical protein JCM21714_3651 [Gracilibacillus boraciitolerans JCM 21714]|uniref:Two-component sensor histidine kinase n=1 Tax=Gracilibacillus boraciitolerans JCM 21714 TaxID=1298598 RepID=W4VM94_9BACI|nr:hypothetical protein [Gracilibacillus boraciitolerans]GAE94490.1 hypothetical protein JCM21714_3651 [Gracilibacillus boraciitolerans JCM 21714]